jgi:RNA polymerase sigma factor (sigma-70 family)
MARLAGWRAGDVSLEPMVALTPELQSMVLTVRPTVADLVGRLRRMFRHVPIEDIEQTVWEGFARAAPRHDPVRGPFHVFGYKYAFGLAIDRLTRDARQTPLRLARKAIGDAFDGLSVSDDPFADDAEILAPLRACCHEGAFRMFFGATFETWRLQGEQGLVEQLARAKAFEALRAAFTTLAPEDWQLLQLYYVECHTWTEVGAAFGIGEKQAQRRAEKIREKLKRELLARGVKDAPPRA